MGTTVDSSAAAGAVATAASGATLNISGGKINESMTLDKSVTLDGGNAGVPQNFDQEV